MKYNYIFIFIISIALLSCFILSKDVIDSSIYIVNFFYDYTFPSLLPILISIYILIDTGCLYYIAYLLQYITIPLFRINGYGALIIIISILTGFPFSTILTTQFLKENKINKKEAYILIATFTIPSFSFIFFSLKSYLSYPNFISLITCIYLCSFILLFFMTRFINKKEFISLDIINSEVNNKLSTFSFSKSLKENVLSLTNSLSIILGTMIYFNIISIFIENIIPINNTIKGIIEFSFPSILASKNNDILSLIIILSFSSFSSIFQCLAIIEDYNLKSYPLILTKIISPFISTIIYLII